MRVLITGAEGFIGKNLLAHLKERKDIQIDTFTRQHDIEALPDKVRDADFIFHLAGINRPKHEAEFFEGNCRLTEKLCEAVKNSGRVIPITYSSSIQAERDNPYGRSKLAAEQALQTLNEHDAVPVYLYRLPNVFGKWCRPNYNSAVATFCHNIAHDLPIVINDPDALISLVYIDDVVADFIEVLEKGQEPGFCEIDPVYNISVGGLADRLFAFKHSRNTLIMEPVGEGLDRALHSTYLSYFRPEQFAYPLDKHEDKRGVFVEVLKTHDSGQFSYFTAHPGVTRGGHYHHSKTEKFLVIKGKARFRFRQIETGETYALEAGADKPEVVETIPGWTHDITNIGSDEMIVMLWANEIFDPERPDTFTSLL